MNAGNGSKKPPPRPGRGPTGPSGTGSRRRRPAVLLIAVVVLFAVIGLYLVYRNSQGGQGNASDASGYRHVAGEPGNGASAPDFTLTSGTGGQVALADFRGKTVLLYFQEGLSCQPCWDQIRDLERSRDALTAAGVDEVVSITTDQPNLIGRKAADEGITTPVLSDPTLAASTAYDANRYGMMGQMRDGHSFVLVGPDGVIDWRADYGGAPDYTMFLPTGTMLADMSAERAR
ncbi:peroxiredoxin family protein [Rhodococcus opacus]|uniref:peroxiredoxin family protein n=1 Tax=Rhodococcus opacus TaxID=37919 RepID=UPI001C475E73|nr:peroxiredoxin family protein [Rhodococcus opacus]MBV6761431.1 peroxiredoxin family protein [Rhodococcus opacus]